mmetsp:Transcript_22824/g.64813  ORF Transcript_22824/g.64813 Transcript_22824/m.64813 type:complete len:220 (-) Transcript_22824:624-1283(-)
MSCTLPWNCCSHVFRSAAILAKSACNSALCASNSSPAVFFPPAVALLRSRRCASSEASCDAAKPARKSTHVARSRWCGSRHNSLCTALIWSMSVGSAALAASTARRWLGKAACLASSSPCSFSTPSPQREPVLACKLSVIFAASRSNFDSRVCWLGSEACCSSRRRCKASRSFPHWVSPELCSKLELTCSASRSNSAARRCACLKRSLGKALKRSSKLF